MDFKKKVCKNENQFFFDFFFRHFFHDLITIIGLTTFHKKMAETIRKKVKNSDFFGFFLDFSNFFGFFWDRMDNFWTTLDNFWTTL